MNARTVCPRHFWSHLCHTPTLAILPPWLHFKPFSKGYGLEMDGTLSVLKVSVPHQVLRDRERERESWHRPHLFSLDSLIFARIVFCSSWEASLLFLKMMGAQQRCLGNCWASSRQCDPRTVCTLDEHSCFSQCGLVYFNTLVYKGNGKNVWNIKRHLGLWVFVFFWCFYFTKY